MEYHSHIGQDMWVAETLDFRRCGYFLEFGSLDGVKHSNTLIFEQEFGWNGICVEANPTYYPYVCYNRRVITINAALWHSSGEIVEMVDAYGLTSVVEHQDNDLVADIRKRDTKRRFKIPTLTPNDLLSRFEMPPIIDYLSLDIEGSELDVLSALDLERFPIALMSVEHSDVPERQIAIRAAIEPHGYVGLKRAYDFLFYHPGHLEKLGVSPARAEAALRKVEAEYQVREG